MAGIRRSPTKPHPSEHAWWRFDRGEIGRVKRILPGGSGGLGIVEFDGQVPAAHVATMMQFSAWEPIPPPVALEAPCSCVTLEGGVVLTDGCARHDARAQGAAVVHSEPERLLR
jgi:hypothetical protein